MQSKSSRQPSHTLLGMVACVVRGGIQEPPSQPDHVVQHPDRMLPACRQDVEIEMDRFENARDATLAKYRMMQRPKGKLADGLNLAVDGIATLCMGESRHQGLQPLRAMPRRVERRCASPMSARHARCPLSAYTVLLIVCACGCCAGVLAVAMGAGLADGQAVPEGDEAMLTSIISFVFPEASSEEVLASIKGRPQRVSAYT